MDDLKEELSKVAAEISWHEEQLAGLLDYAKSIKLKKEIVELKQHQILLNKEIEKRKKQRDFIHDRRSMKKIGIFGGGRTKFL